MADGFDAAEALRAGLGNRQRAWDFIRRFAAEWTTPLAPGGGNSVDTLWAVEQRLGAELPAALREAYLLFGRRPDLMARQDRLVPLPELDVDDTRTTVVFRTENQNCAAWGVAVADMGREDPPVYVRHTSDWQLFLDRVSVTCVEMVLSEVLLGRRQLHDMCAPPVELIAAVESAYQQIAVPEYRLWAEPSTIVRWFAAPGKLLRMDGRGPYCYLVAGGQTLADLESIRATVPGPWARVRWTGQ